MGTSLSCLELLLSNLCHFQLKRRFPFKIFKIMLIVYKYELITIYETIGKLKFLCMTYLTVVSKSCEKIKFCGSLLSN